MSIGAPSVDKPTNDRTASDQLTGDERSASSVTEAITLVVLFLVLLFAVIDMGRALLVKMDLDDAARDGAIAAALSDTFGVDLIRARVQDSATRVDLRTENIEVTCHAEPATDERHVEVSVQYQHSLVTPLVSTLAGPLEITSTSRLQRFAPGLPCDDDV